MADSDGKLTLEGLAQILREHMDGTAAQFAEVGARLDVVGVRIERLARIVGDLTQLSTRHDAEIAEHRRLHEEHSRHQEEHRQHIRQVFARMEEHDARMEQFAARMAEHDARFEAMSREIRQILDAMQRRGGDGGDRPT